MDDETKEYVDSKFEELVTLLAKSFSGIERKMNERFDSVDNRLDHLGRSVRDERVRIDRIEDAMF